MKSELDYKALATESAGNHKLFDSFAWFDRPADADKWAIVYTANRDSGLLDQSNAATIAKAMEPFTEGDDPDAVAERHNHWACGWVDGYAIRCLDDQGEPTAAFKVWANLQARLADYHILDEDDYGTRESDATYNNFVSAATMLANRYDLELKEGWESAIQGHLDAINPNWTESSDDQGGYPEDDDLEEAFTRAGYLEDADMVAAG